MTIKLTFADKLEGKTFHANMANYVTMREGYDGATKKESKHLGTRIWFLNGTSVLVKETEERIKELMETK